MFDFPKQKIEIFGYKIQIPNLIIGLIILLALLQIYIAGAVFILGQKNKQIGTLEQEMQSMVGQQEQVNARLNAVQSEMAQLKSLMYRLEAKNN
jgi:hypothetical protein